MISTVAGKQANIERCIAQVRRYDAMETGIAFQHAYLRHDGIAIHLQRICALCLDIAHIWVRSEKLGLPSTRGEAFALIRASGAISNSMYEALRGMVGFRNVLVHPYQLLDLDTLVDVIEHHLDQPLECARLALGRLP